MTEDDEGDYNVRIRWRYGDKAGEHTTKAHLTFVDGKQFCFYWEEGNMACDCNRSVAFNLPEMTCGETIQVESIEIIDITCAEAKKDE